MTAAELSPDDFPAFFRAVYGVEPFPWQARLLNRVAGEGIWPKVLDLPTGAGKTAALDIAVFHLALEASRGTGRRAPVRIAFVVDRRLIVDNAFERARQLARCVAESEEPVVTRVATALRRLAADGERPLMVRRLRGGMPREDDWARTPVQPTILCSTVDQVGSRLLFRGYGISDRMKPVHAGLLGSDCLILLDEAHLAEPFRQTLAGIQRLSVADHAPWGVALLTATPGNESDAPFTLSDADRAHPLLSSRLHASKPTRLIEIPGRTGIPAEVQRTDAAAEEARAALIALQAAGISNPAIGIVVNRVARARAVFEQLKEWGSADAILVIGPARDLDREDRTKELGPIRTRDPEAPRMLPKPLFVVATQTIEAGVDIDLDGLVTEAAALDALRQRFGRANRAGRSMTPVSAILAHKDDIGGKADDPVYGDRIAKTWTELNRIADPATRVIDFGIDALAEHLNPVQASELAAPKQDSPVLLPAYADLWAQTSPIPNADPEVSLFLHGPDRSPASVQLVWRADLRTEDLRAGEVRDLVERLRLMPSRAAEAIEIPLWAARAWLRQEDELLTRLADIAERAPDDSGRGRGRAALRYAGLDNPRSRIAYAPEIRDGDLIIVPVEYGGCDKWGWNPNSTEAVMDVAAAAGFPYRGRRFAVRVTPELIRQEAAQDTAAQPIGRDGSFEHLSATLDAHADESAVALFEAVLSIELPARLREDLQRLRQRKGRLERAFLYGKDESGRPRGVAFVAPFGLRDGEETERLAAAPATEADDIGSTPGYAQDLDEHSDEVQGWARAFVDRAGLEPAAAADLALAAYLHDAGKADPRFQAYLAGGDPIGRDEDRVLAKSGYAALPHGAWERAGLPDHWRHEALSVRLALLHDRFAGANDPELVLWLIGVHHGFGRPLFPHADPWDHRSHRDLPRALGRDWSLPPGYGPQSLAFDFRGRDWAQIFEELKRRYGIWGLARLEAFVRLADHRASEAAAQRYAAAAPMETAR
jgi:CRISPR-associated endonuclease/helicase Cas3